MAVLPQKIDMKPHPRPHPTSRTPLIVGAGAASPSGAVFNLSTTIVGAGIMALPAAVKALGLIPGLLAIAAAARLTESSIQMIVRSGRVSSPKPAAAASYADLVGESFGSAGKALTRACVVLNNLGMLVVYMIILGDVMSGTSSETTHHTGVIEGWYGPQWWTSRTFLLLFTTLFVFAPLISFKRVDSLRYTSALSVALAFVFVAITAIVAVVKLFDGTASMPRLLPEMVDWNLFTTVPVLITSFVCHYSIHPIESELRDPGQMMRIVRVSLTLCTSVYMATSLFGVLLFGEGTLDDVLANFDVDLDIPLGALLSDVVRVSYAAHLMLVFPIVFYSLRQNVDGFLFPRAVPLAQDKQRFFATTAFLMALAFLGANYVPSIWDAFQFMGATTSVVIGFILPAALTLRDVHGVTTKNDRILSWFMIFLAVSTSFVAISSDVYAFFGGRRA
ncbi:hypothetical protein QJS10_CPA02g00063 [Acorus calamus]|uniref:Amino acid transporter transmembrane domain-containing protein n=1 Tax=Acorus calamus TaxID=4465 RepID=A0AAV9FGJ3_ACOCL|nr:hypothetical protein QJS10_CPA02g00063 [Acorus calamus]